MREKTRRGWIRAIFAFAVLFAATLPAGAAEGTEAEKTCEDARRDQLDQAYRDAKLKLKAQELLGDAEGVRLAKLELKAAQSNYCDCLRRIYIATKVMPDNFMEICWPRGRRAFDDWPDDPGRTRGQPQPAPPVPCAIEWSDFEIAKKELNDFNQLEPEPFEEQSHAAEKQRLDQEYENAWKKYCECLKRHYGARLSQMDKELCKELPDPAARGGRGGTRTAPRRSPPKQIDPSSGDAPADDRPQEDSGVTPPRKPKAPRTGAPPPPPPPPAADPNTPVPPGPGMPAPPGPGMPAADCLRDGVWNVTFTVEQHNDNHDHTVCVRFLRRLIQMTLGDFLGDLFSARFEDLLPQMECTKVPGCSGSCKGTLPNFAGKENVEFEIQNLRRSGDTITGRLAITSGGQTLFILKFTATPAVTA